MSLERVKQLALRWARSRDDITAKKRELEELPRRIEINEKAHAELGQRLSQELKESGQEAVVVDDGPLRHVVALYPEKPGYGPAITFKTLPSAP